MMKVLRLFFGVEGMHPLVTLFCLLLAGLCQAIGIGTLLPALSAIAGNGPGASPLNQIVRETIAALGIDPVVPNLILIVVAALVLRSAVAFAALGYTAYEVARLATRLRVELFDSVFAARWRFHADKKLGHLANAISTDSFRAADAYNSAATFAASGVECLTYIAVAIAIDWRVGVVGSLLAAITSSSVAGLLSSTRRAGKRQFARISELTALMADVTGNLKPIKAMDRFAGLRAVIGRKITSLRRVLFKKDLARVGLGNATDALAAILLGAILYVAVVIWHWRLPELMVTALLFYQVMAATNRAQRNLQNAIELESAYWRVRALIGEARNERETHAGKLLPRLEHSCRFEHVDFSHEGVAVIHDVVLDIAAGEITVLQGPSGSGKTTIIDLLTGLHLPDRGRIAIDGVDLRDIDMGMWRRSVGYVPQELTLLHGTVRDNISLGDSAITDEQIRSALTLAGAAILVSGLPRGLDTDVGSMGAKLSGGQRQRIALARALVVDPKLLILDEVTSALDPDTEAEICDNIAKLRGRYTIVAITHRPAWTKVAGRLYKVSHGRVNEISIDHRLAAVEAD